MHALSLSMTPTEVNLMQNLVVMAMITSSEMSWWSPHQTFAFAAEWGALCAGLQSSAIWGAREAHDVLPMTWDWFKVAGTENIDIVLKGAEGLLHGRRLACSRIVGKG
jgi:hypothetical protein